MDKKVKLAEDLINAIKEEKLKLPTQPEVAVRLRECAEDPNLSPEKLAQIISHDPAMTAKLIQVANSPLNRGTVTIFSLPNVISRLGIQYVCNVASGLAMQQIFQATNENIDKLMHDAWSSSAHVAAYSHVLAKNYSAIPSDVASIAGLMHQIGILPILSYVQDHDDLANDISFLTILLRDNHAKIGVALLKTWQFPPEIYNLPQNLYKSTDTDIPIADLKHIVQAALFKTNEDHKLLFEIDSLSDDVFKHLNTNKEEAFANPNIQSQLQAAMQFYCQLH
ncbi:MAG: HDOD domain-containing protein [Candidatus Berkiella sp.]